MRFDWLLYFRIADNLMKPTEPHLQEACFRSATSRFYYGTFGKCREILENKGYKFVRERIHREVIQVLKTTCMEAGVYLDRLRKERNIADYDGTVIFTEEKVYKSKEFAKKNYRKFANIEIVQ